MFNNKYVVEIVNNMEVGYAAKCKYSLLPLIGTCIVTVDEKYKNDAGLLEHEIEHVKQYSKNPLHALMYKWCSWYRYKCEIAAYKIQTKVYGYTEKSQYNWIVNAMLDKYNIHKSKEQILEDLVD